MSVKGKRHPLNRKIVVFFDICSSTRIVEDLIATHNTHKWADLQIDLKSYLFEQSRAKEREFEIYKFLGDGYILLFPASYHPATLLEVLSGICRHFATIYAKDIKPLLDRPPKISGITVGIDAGRLIRLKMRNRIEYLGRALNVAARLQGAIKDKDAKPAGKALISAHYCSHLKKLLPNYKVTRVKRSLRNIGEDITCFKVNLLKTSK